MVHATYRYPLIDAGFLGALQHIIGGYDSGVTGECQRALSTCMGRHSIHSKHQSGAVVHSVRDQTLQHGFGIWQAEGR